MADLKAQIEITADATGVEAGIGRAKRSLADLAAAAKTAGADASQGLSGAGNGGAEAATKIDRATQNIIGSIQRASAAATAGGKATSAYFESIAKQRGISSDVLKPFLADLDAANEGAKRAGHGMEGFSFATAGAKRELLVLGHELSQGNFSRFGSSLLVLGERTGAASLLFSGFGVATLGATVVLSAFAAAAAIGAQEAETLRRSLILTNQAAGLTAGQFNEFAKSIAEGTRTSVGSATETLQTLVSSGRFTGESLKATSTAVQLLAKATGESTDDISKRFVGLSDDVGKGAEELNKQYHFLSGETLAYIKTLSDQGDAQKAVQLTMQELASQVAGAAQPIGALASYWDRAKLSALGYVEAVKNLGKPDTIDDAITRSKKDSATLRGAANNTAVAGFRELFRTFTGPSFGEQADENDALVKRLELTKKVGEEVSAASARSAAANQAQNAFNGLQEASLSRQKKLANELEKAKSLYLKSDGRVTKEQYDTLVSDIKDKYKDPKGAQPRNTDRSSLRAEIDAIKAEESERLDVYRNSQTILSALRSAGLVSDQQYYDAEAKAAQDSADVQIKAIDDQIAAQKRKRFSGPGAANEEFERQSAIGKLEADRVRVIQDTAAKEAALSTERTSASQRRLAAAAAEYQAAARQLDATQRQYDLDLEVSKLAPQAAADAQARAQINGKYASDLKKAQDDFANLPRDAAGAVNADDQKKYDQEIDRIKGFRDKSLAQYSDYYAQRKVQDANYFTGLDRATATYIENAQNVAKLTEQAYTNVFSSIEDALVQFVTKGKFSFKSLADSIISEFVRIEAKAAVSKVLQSVSSNGGAGGISSAIGGYFSGGGASGAADTASLFANGFAGFASGGYATPRSIHEVNERGPELLETGGRTFLMMSGQGGRVIPHDQAFGGGVPTIINQTTGRVDQATMVRTGPNPEDRALLLQEAEAHIARQLYDPNSAVSRSMKRNVKAERNR